MDKLHYETEWMAICRGLPAYRVAQILNRHSPGTDWTHCSKRHMAEAWVAAHLKEERSFSGRIQDPAALRKELEEAPRETPAERKRKKAKRNLEQRISRLKSMMEYALETAGGTEELADTLLKLKPAEAEIRMLVKAWQEESKHHEQVRARARSEMLYCAQLEMAANRALGKMKES
jgi:hypothetical protein